MEVGYVDHQVAKSSYTIWLQNPVNMSTNALSIPMTATLDTKGNLVIGNVRSTFLLCSNFWFLLETKSLLFCSSLLCSRNKNSILWDIHKMVVHIGAVCTGTGRS
jgi:hypothetical protein